MLAPHALQSPGGLGFGMPYEKPGLGTEAAVAVAVAVRRGGGGMGGRVGIYLLIRW